MRRKNNVPTILAFTSLILEIITQNSGLSIMLKEHSSGLRGSDATGFPVVRQSRSLSPASGPPNRTRTASVRCFQAGRVVTFKSSVIRVPGEQFSAVWRRTAGLEMRRRKAIFRHIYRSLSCIRFCVPCHQLLDGNHVPLVSSTTLSRTRVRHILQTQQASASGLNRVLNDIRQ